MNIICIASSNIEHKASQKSTSYKICQIVINEMEQRLNGEVKYNIIELKNKVIQPCVGCGKCFRLHRCLQVDDFNSIYTNIIKADIIVIVSPHYAPIPAKLAALLEKMEQITFLHWGRDTSYKSEVFGKITGVISHGGGGDWALKSYKHMVNDTIANALDTIQLKVVPRSNEWDTGISLPVKNVSFSDDSIFPIQEYDWNFITREISLYIEQIITLSQ